jgi:YHS domain-containing protein
VPYPLKTCIVSGEEFGGDMGDPVVIEYQGREIKFCCSSCVKKFNKDPEKYIKSLDEKAKQQKEQKEKAK